MRFKDAISYHYKKHMINYGIVSAIVTLVSVFFIDEVVQFLNKLADGNMTLTLVFCLIYALIMVAVATPAAVAVAWIAGWIE